MVDKCKYFNDCTTTCTLMLDDMVPAAVSIDNEIKTSGDWGYLLDLPGSLYDYFNQNLLKKYPEIKGTIFMPLESQHYIDKSRGFNVYSKPITNSEYLKYLDRISHKFEVAFHGIKHHYFCKIKNGNIHEFTSINKEELLDLANKTREFQKSTGLNFIGGKFPGYKYNEQALQMLELLNTKWWALDIDMINKKHKKNCLIVDPRNNIVHLPSNITGDIFLTSLRPYNKIKKLIKRVFTNKYFKDPIGYLYYLYNNRLPITIQEHFQNQKTDGKRQTPNVYDDIYSLDILYGILRPLDIWHATCSEIAHYFESYTNSNLEVLSKNTFSIVYSGTWPEMFLSVKTNTPKIMHINTGEELQGIFKNEGWIFNNIPVGEYRLL